MHDYLENTLAGLRARANADPKTAVREVAKQYLDGNEITEGLLNHIEVAIRAYDPCLSCATHALGNVTQR